jgi:oligogalacturonide lyase
LHLAVDGSAWFVALPMFISPVFVSLPVLNRNTPFSTMAPIAMRLNQIPILLSLLVISLHLTAKDAPPSDWIDPDTGHRVVRLSTEPGSESLYFNENAWTAQGDKLVYYASDGIYDYNFKSRQNELVMAGTNISGVIVSRNSRKAYYIRRDGSELTAYSTRLDTHETREIGNAPGGGSVLAVNADDTLLAGSFVENQDRFPRPTGESKGEWMARRLAVHQHMALFTLNIQTGKLNAFNHCTDWLNHVQFSPTDPDLIMFCHEGPWHLVDRIWTIHADGTALKLIQPRTIQMEIAGHEFFSPDGKWIWYDLQTPRGEDFWLGGYEITTGRRLWYHMQRDDWSIHFNVSHDDTLFAGDGGDAR